MDIFIYLYSLTDHFLMFFFRLPGNSVTGYFLGTFILASISIVLGEYSISLAFRLNKKQIASNNQIIDRFQDLSIEALKTGEKSAYKACNSIANDAFGKNFFAQIALSAASLWPVFISLGWMQYRFSEVEILIPAAGEGFSFGYVSTFALCYISARLFFAKVIGKIPFIKPVSRG